MIIIAAVIVCEGCLVISHWVARYFIYFIIMFVCHNLSETVLSAVSMFLENLAQFTHKPDQLELQLDWSRLLYLENLGLVQQEAAQYH